MNKKRLGIASAAIAAAVAISGFVAPAQAAGSNLVIWTDSDRAKGLKEASAAWAAKNGVTLTVVVKDFGKVRDEMITAGPKGLGPDILIAPHDWVGGLAASGALERVSLTNRSAFPRTALDGFTYRGILYGIPYNVENIALVYNTKLVSSAPKTLAEMESTWATLKAAGTAKVGIDVQTGNPYMNTPLFTALGGYVFGGKANHPNPRNVGLYSAKFAKNASKIDKWFASGFLNKNSDWTYTNFYAGKAPYAIMGPWNLEDLHKSGMASSYAIAGVPGGYPWIGANGFMVSKYAPNKFLAKSYIANVVTDVTFQYTLYKSTLKMPALLAAAAKVDNQDLLAMSAYRDSSGAMPMWNIPQMASVWTDWGNAWQTVADGKSTAAAAFKLAAANVKKLVS
ncbi:MAG: extracellular solute-binding protein [Actinomycetota bacterium]